MRFALLVALLVAPLAAQEGRNWPLWNPAIMKELNLSEMQTREIRSVIKDYRPRLIDLKATMDKAEGAVEDAFGEDPFDGRRATDACERVIAARTELARVFSQMNTKLRAILTIDQWRELQKRTAKARAAAGQNTQAQ